jgi:hypothetical protein
MHAIKVLAGLFQKEGPLPPSPEFFVCDIKIDIFIVNFYNIKTTKHANSFMEML